MIGLAVLTIAVGIGSAAYFGMSAARQREAIVAKVGDSGAHFDRAVALHKAGKLPEAIEEYRAALRIIPGSAEAHYNLGVALHSQGDKAGAIAEFQKARANAERGSELAGMIDNALKATGQ
jgi:Flp pilus assembly protein TadD